MQLIEHFWATVTTIVSIFTLSPSNNDIIENSPLQVSLPTSLGLLVTPHMKLESGPVFQPPGTPNSSSFQCNYSSMVGWESCSIPTDRKCWLRRISDGKQYDIFTDYENDIPNGTTRYYELDLKDSSFDADGIKFSDAKLFNDTYPGPWIEACWGDRVIVNVTNSLQYNGTSVHWHGIRQNQTMYMDGVNGITQCPIAPGDYFVYNFTAGQYGSSWYHSHYSVQYADGAAGPITLHGPSSDNFNEAISPPLIMTDWGHNSAFNALSSGLYEPDILLNGRGNITKYNNSLPNSTEVLPPYNITFQGPQEGLPNNKYLIRIINTSFQTTFIFSIDNHMLTVVEADFVPISPYMNTSILVGIGQRYDVIVEAKPQKDPNKRIPLPSDGNYWIRTFVIPCFAHMEPGNLGYEETGILRYNSSSTADPSSSQWTDIPLNTCLDETYTSLHPIVQWTIGDSSNNPPAGERFDIGFNSGGYPMAVWNLGSAASPSLRVDYSNITFFNLDNKGSWNNVWRVQPEDYNATNWIYLVIVAPSHHGSHPMHLHGHDFAILEQAANKVYHPNTTDLLYNNPPRRDVVLLPSSGYVVIAFKADNPGTWLVHCHIAFHIAGGLGLQIMEDQEAAAKKWPTNNSTALANAKRVCNKWDTWYSNLSHHYPQPNCHDGEELCFQNDSGV